MVSTVSEHLESMPLPNTVPSAPPGPSLTILSGWQDKPRLAIVLFDSLAVWPVPMLKTLKIPLILFFHLLPCKFWGR